MEAEPDAQAGETDVDQPATPNPTRPPLWKRFGWRITAGVVLYVIVAGLLLLTVPDQLLRNWFPDFNDAQRARYLGPAANIVLFALGGTIALVGVGLSLSRHRQELDASERDRERLHDDREREQARRNEVEAQLRIGTERALRERFVTTVKLLSDPAPVNRQAALFALGALADDWYVFGKTDEVQVCIEVLTGYLRAPRSDDMLVPLTEDEHDQLDPAERRDAQRTTPQEIAVRQAGYAVIRNHLLRDSSPSWHGKEMNLAQVHIDFNVDLWGVNLSGTADINFESATVTGPGRINLSQATISGNSTLNFSTATISGRGVVDLSYVSLEGGDINLDTATITCQGRVYLDHASIAGNSAISLNHANLGGRGSIALQGATVTERGIISVDYLACGLASIHR